MASAVRGRVLLLVPRKPVAAHGMGLLIIHYQDGENSSSKTREFPSFGVYLYVRDSGDSGTRGKTGESKTKNNINR